MSNKIVLALDLYGTILDPSSMQAHLADKFPGSAATLTSLWRRYQLEYTWRATAQGTYQPFESITRRALLHALAECSEKFNQEDVDEIMSKYETLQMFPDVEETLQKLHDQNTFDLVLFTNGSPLTIQNAQSTHPILKTIFPPSKVFSVDRVYAYKPSREAYKHLAQSLGKNLQSHGDVVLISSNPFDICGAGAQGMRTLWINRGEGGWVDQLGWGPTWTAKSFAELATFKA